MEIDNLSTTEGYQINSSLKEVPPSNRNGRKGVLSDRKETNDDPKDGERIRHLRSPL